MWWKSDIKIDSVFDSFSGLWCRGRIFNYPEQTLDDIEIIMVDDGSPDRVPFMCDDYAKKDSRIKIVHKENGGLGYARNSGLDLATGEYDVFIEIA